MAIRPEIQSIDSYIRDAGQLGRALDLNPRRIDTELLAEDIFEATPSDERARMPLTAAARRLAGFITAALPAYVADGGYGPRLPQHIPGHDNINRHIPRALDDYDLEQVDNGFSWDAWRQYVHSLASWVAVHTGNDPATYRVEDAAVGLLLANPHLEVGSRTVNSLAGSLGMSDLAEIIEGHYSAGTRGHWAPETEWDYYDDAAQDDEDNHIHIADQPDPWEAADTFTSFGDWRPTRHRR